MILGTAPFSGDNGDVPPSFAAVTPSHPNPRWAVAQEIAEALRRRWGMQLQAVGVHGSLAHGDDDDSSDVDIVAVMRQTSAGPPAGARRVRGVIVDLGVIAAEEYLRHARTLTTSWPLAADQYITTKPLHDPDGWLPRLRDAHLARLAKTEGHVFASLAREAWCRATSAQARARRLAEWFQTEAAMQVLGEARLGVALVDGLLTRTYFRNGADAVARAGVASAHIYELGERLASQAAQLEQRGRPVDGEVDDLFG